MGTAPGEKGLRFLATVTDPGHPDMNRSILPTTMWRCGEPALAVVSGRSEIGSSSGSGTSSVAFFQCTEILDISVSSSICIIAPVVGRCIICIMEAASTAHDFSVRA